MAFLRVIYMQNSLILNRCTYPLLLAYGLTHTFEQPFKFDHLHLGSVHTFHAIEFHYEEWPLKSLSIYFFSEHGATEGNDKTSRLRKKNSQVAVHMSLGNDAVVLFNFMDS